MLEPILVIFLSALIIAVTLAVIYIREERKKVSEGQINKDPLTWKGKIFILILYLLVSIFAPSPSVSGIGIFAALPLLGMSTEFLPVLVLGVIFYFSWKKRLPVKARQAIRMSFLLYFIEIVLYYLPLVFALSGMLG